VSQERGYKALIDCYRSGQISETQWVKHLAADPGLWEEYTARPSRYKLSDGTDISRKTVEQITAAQRKLSPIFPTILDARERRARFHETVAARGSLALSVVFSVWAFFADAWLGPTALAAACFASFVIMCFIAGNRKYRKEGSIPQRGDY
jgi:hypothetical protein